MEFGTAWAGFRRWKVRGWSDVAQVSAGIRNFFDNTDEFLKEEAKVYKILDDSNDRTGRVLGLKLCKPAKRVAWNSDVTPRKALIRWSRPLRLKWTPMCGILMVG